MNSNKTNFFKFLEDAKAGRDLAAYTEADRHNIASWICHRRKLLATLPEGIEREVLAEAIEVYETKIARKRSGSGFDFEALRKAMGR